jgi:phenylpropionate dioxygenase-like ring-hydroxylating dioxygenase large terminal subunit
MTTTAKQITSETYHAACKNTGLVQCPSHGAEVDSDGWCIACDTPMDDGPAGVVKCECQDD